MIIILTYNKVSIDLFLIHRGLLIPRVWLIFRARTLSHTEISNRPTASWTATGCLKLPTTGSILLRRSKRKPILQSIPITEASMKTIN